ncbi:ribosome-associated GTPase [Escherichia coli]|uniref:Ribosome-associated GTPase n=1 Tax=Escherichia coli TaxID=562 RepID=A0A376VX72_ECOLX|nr:ribosome-associated GTPase [Escherichia coli]
MSKNKLSKGQQRRVNANHQRRLKTSKEKPDYDDNLFGEPDEGIVISRFGMHADVESADGDVHRCNIRRTIRSLVTGDRVVWRPGKPAAEGVNVKGIVEAVHERTSVLTRPDFYDGVKTYCRQHRPDCHCLRHFAGAVAQYYRPLPGGLRNLAD